MIFDFDKQYADEWKKLGFYYDLNHDAHCWRLSGSKNGLINFCDLLSKYVHNPMHSGISEHEHYGPDSYLKVVTWYFPTITKDGIYGSLQDIQKLETLIRSKLLMAGIEGEIHINQDYSDKNEYYLTIKVMSDGFDPSKPDETP